MRVVPFDQLDSAEWDSFCDKSPGAWLFHRSAWISIETVFFGATSHSFAVCDRDRIVGVHPFYHSSVSIGWSEELLHSGIHRHTGLALSAEMGLSEKKAIYAAVTRHMFELAAKLGVDRIQLNVQNLTPESMSLSRQEVPFWLEAGCGFYEGINFSPTGMLPAPGLSTACLDQIVSLSVSEVELFSRLDESCRRAVRKAVNAGLKFEAVTIEGPQSCDEYYRLAQLSAARTGESIAPQAYFREILSSFSASGRAAIVFALHEGKRVGAVLLGIDKGSSSFLGGVSDPEYLPMRVNDFLHWSVIRWAKGFGLHCYRLGPLFPEVHPEWPIAKVSKFKGKFGGKSYRFIQGSKFIHPEKYADGAVKHIQMVCECDIGVEIEEPEIPATMYPVLPVETVEVGFLGRVFGRKRAQGRK